MRSIRRPRANRFHSLQHKRKFAMKEQKTTFTEQIADEGGYITQAAEVPDEERLYLTRRVKLPGEKAGTWRDATADEKKQYDMRMAEKYPIPAVPGFYVGTQSEMANIGAA